MEVHTIKTKTQPQDVQETTFQEHQDDGEKNGVFKREDLKLVYPKLANKHQSCQVLTLKRTLQNQDPLAEIFEEKLEFLKCSCT